MIDSCGTVHCDATPVILKEDSEIRLDYVTALKLNYVRALFIWVSVY